MKDIDRAVASSGKGKSTASESLKSINRKCQSLGIKTIAEYVESRAALEPLEQLRLMEVDFAQGLKISSPQPLF